MKKGKTKKGNEIGAVSKEWGGRTSIGLVYPNTYYIGMSNLAIHLLYKVLNEDPKIVAERIFLSDKIVSEESGRPISDFRVLAFTFSFEADYLNIPKILGKNIPLLREERDENFPLLIAGGPAVSMNPTALSKIFDIIAVGESEEILDEITEILKENLNREETLEKLSTIKGIFVPDTKSDVRKVERIYTKDLNSYPTHSVIWTDDTEFGHMHLVEVARGCPWNCRFCATPPLYSPYRMRSADAIWKSIEYGLPHRNHIGLIGSDVLGHPNFKEIANELIERGIKVSTSSLRVNRIDKEVASILIRSGHKRATLGIEAGTERLRNLLDKSLTDENIFQTVNILSQEGITNLKLYFMIGLPGETEDDIESIAALAKEIREIILKERKLKTLAPNISLVVTPFIPKKTTPFEDEPFAGTAYLKGALKKLRALIQKVPNTKITGESPKQSEMEYRLSEGDLKDII